MRRIINISHEEFNTVSPEKQRIIKRKIGEQRRSASQKRTVPIAVPDQVAAPKAEVVSDPFTHQVPVPVAQLVQQPVVVTNKPERSPDHGPSNSSRVLRPPADEDAGPHVSAFEHDGIPRIFEVETAATPLALKLKRKITRAGHRVNVEGDYISMDAATLRAVLNSVAKQARVEAKAEYRCRNLKISS